MKNSLFWLLFLALIIRFDVQAQQAGPLSPALATAVSVDLEKHTIGDIPFDKPFYFVGEIKEKSNIHSITFEIAKGRSSKAEFKTIEKVNPGSNNQFIVLFLPGILEKDFLLPDREYTLRIISMNENEQELKEYSFTYGFLTSSKFGDHTKLDFGVGYAPIPKAFFGYTSVNIYLTPINDETNLQRITSFKRNVFLRMSFFMGISIINFSSDTKQPIKNKYGAGNFVFGIGIRSPFYGCYTKFFHNKVGQKLLQPMRLTVGKFLFKQANANPLIPDDVNKNAVYIGLTYDINIASILGPIGKIIAP
jgi:hypothetical protein